MAESGYPNYIAIVPLLLLRFIFNKVGGKEGGDDITWARSRVAWESGHLPQIFST
jgi:hypothetical protein